MRLKPADVIAALAAGLKAAEDEFYPETVPLHNHRDDIHWDDTTGKVCRKCAAWRKAWRMLEAWKAQQKGRTR